MRLAATTCHGQHHAALTGLQATGGAGGDASVSEIELDERRQLLRNKQRMSDQLQASAEASQKRLQELKSAHQQAARRREVSYASVEELNSTKAALEERLQEHAKSMEKLLNKKNLLVDKRDSSKKKISELGACPMKQTPIVQSDSWHLRLSFDTAKS